MGQRIREVSYPCSCRAQKRDTCVFSQVSLGGVSHPAVPKGTEHLPEPVMPNTALLVKNPLASTHVFKQACHICYPKTGDAFALPPRVLPGVGSASAQADGVVLSCRAQGWRLHLPGRLGAQVQARHPAGQAEELRRQDLEEDPSSPNQNQLCRILLPVQR